MALGHNVSIDSIDIVKCCIVILTKVFPSSLTVRNIQVKYLLVIFSSPSKVGFWFSRNEAIMGQ